MRRIVSVLIFLCFLAALGLACKCSHDRVERAEKERIEREKQDRPGREWANEQAERPIGVANTESSGNSVLGGDKK